MQPFEIRRVGGSYAVEEIRSKFDEFGVVLLKEYLAPETRTTVRELLTEKLERSRARGNVMKLAAYPDADFILGDVLSIRELEHFDYIFFGREMIQVLKTILKTPDLVYYGDSSAQFDHAARGFHKDHVDRYDATTNDWVGDYSIVRAAFYAEDHSRHSGGLKVRLSSHNARACRSIFNAKKISQHAGRALDLRTEYGDIVIWSMRLTHSGNFRKLKWLPGLTLHPRLESVFPDWLYLPEQQRRYFLSCAFARPGAHLEHYLENMLSREKDYRMYLEKARNAEDATRLLEPRGVSFRKPSDYFGRAENDA